MKLKELAEKLGCELEGSGEVEITGIASLDEAGEGDLSFVAHPKYLPRLGTSKASAFILSPDVSPCEKPTLRTPNPYLTFAKALTLFFPPSKPTPGIHPTAVIAEEVPLGEGVSVGPFSVLEEGVSVGDGTVIGPLVYIGKGSRIGKGCLLYPLVTVRE
ncbi:MAG: LpxD N-terminal domain-containing protein, partial [Candidatus Methylomirabilales bacterium]